MNEPITEPRRMGGMIVFRSSLVGIKPLIFCVRMSRLTSGWARFWMISP